MPVDISSIPLYIKSGAIIPMAENQIYNLMHETVTGLHILMAPDVDSEFTVYDDDGKTNEYQNGAYLKTNIKVTAGVRTCVDFIYEGNYENTVDTMYLDVVHREKAPFYVQIDGVEVPHFLHRRKFEEAADRLVLQPELKVGTGEVPNPKKDHHVMISFEVFDMIGM